MKKRITLLKLVPVLVWLVLSGWLVIDGPSVHAQKSPLQGLEAYIEKAMQEWEVPGLAIAIVKDDKVVFAKGYGVREIGKGTPIDENTVFAIGSSSKAFTAASLAMLIDKGKVNWDDPVTKYLVGFQLFDPYVTRELTVRDLLTHRSGLGQSPALWYGSDYDREEILRRIRYLEPSWSFRSRFGYQNVMYLAAGQIIPAVTGVSWDDFVQQRIFTPLGMNSTNTSVTDLKGLSNVARPHGKIDDKVKAIPYRNVDNIGPAGSINSNVVDLAQWVRLQLSEGLYQSERLLSPGVVQEMHTPQTIIPDDLAGSLLAPGAHFRAYGMGWYLHDYHGRKLVHHAGNFDGMSALVTMIPEEKLGLIILTNMSINMGGMALPYALMYRIFDAYLGVPERDWSSEVLQMMRGFQEQGKTAMKKMEEARVKETTPSLPLTKYVGTYENELYGEMGITHKDGMLVLYLSPAATGDLEHWNYDTFRLAWYDPVAEMVVGKPFVTFVLNTEAEVAEVKIPFIADFKRVPEAKP